MYTFIFSHPFCIVNNLKRIDKFNTNLFFTPSHYPTTKFTVVSDTPENLRLAKQSKQQSQVNKVDANSIIWRTLSSNFLNWCTFFFNPSTFFTLKANSFKKNFFKGEVGVCGKDYSVFFVIRNTPCDICPCHILPHIKCDTVHVLCIVLWNEVTTFLLEFL